MSLRSMPEGVRELRHAWSSQADRIPGLTWELEQDFRFGQRVTKTDTGYMMGGTLKGGSSSMWYPAVREHYHAYKRWRSQEGLQEGRDDEAYAGLQELCDRNRIQVATRRRGGSRRQLDDEEPYPGFGALYADMWQILRALPERHLMRPALGRIQLGGWGPDAAKASAYVDGGVHMYDFACRGARRTFQGLFLHELGHAHECDLSEAEKDAIYAGYKVLLDEGAFFGVEFLVDAETRKLYQRLVFNEFLAETYMIYAACGAALREAIAGLSPAAFAAWGQVYDVFRASFDGVEYE